MSSLGIFNIRIFELPIFIGLCLSGAKIAFRSNGLVLAFEKGSRQHTVHVEHFLQSLFHIFLRREDVGKFKHPVFDFVFQLEMCLWVLNDELASTLLGSFPLILFSLVFILLE